MDNLSEAQFTNELGKIGFRELITATGQPRLFRDTTGVARGAIFDGVYRHRKLHRLATINRLIYERQRHVICIGTALRRRRAA